MTDELTEPARAALDQMAAAIDRAMRSALLVAPRKVVGERALDTVTKTLLNT